MAWHAISKQMELKSWPWDKFQNLCFNFREFEYTVYGLHHIRFTKTYYQEQRQIIVCSVVGCVCYHFNSSCPWWVMSNELMLAHIYHFIWPTIDRIEILCFLLPEHSHNSSVKTQRLRAGPSLAEVEMPHKHWSHLGHFWPRFQWKTHLFACNHAKSTCFHLNVPWT